MCGNAPHPHPGRPPQALRFVEKLQIIQMLEVPHKNRLSRRKGSAGISRSAVTPVLAGLIAAVQAAGVGQGRLEMLLKSVAVVILLFTVF